jgi:hypothetical protein
LQNQSNGRNPARGRFKRRTNRDDSLVEAVGWRLFKSEEIPDRLRRLRALEKATKAGVDEANDLPVGPAVSRRPGS